jgi:hypothetical protein
MAMELSASVGEGGENGTSDVLVVQKQLVSRGFIVGLPDGLCGGRTRAAIKTFQRGFLHNPDGRVDPGGVTWRHLVAEQPAPVTTGGPLTRLVPKPDSSTINNGLKAVNNSYMTAKLGAPRDSFSADCQPVTNERLRRHILSMSVGPFRVTGLKPAVLSLQQVVDAIRDAQPEVYRGLGTAGMLCARWVRGSTTSISNHSWGTAIDIKINGVLDARGNGRVQFGLTLIAPIFNRFGWYWGAAFPTEDGMHFEASRSLLDSWAGALT